MRLTPNLEKALFAWQKWFQGRLDRINEAHRADRKPSEDYSSYEMDLLEGIYSATEKDEVEQAVLSERLRDLNRQIEVACSEENDALASSLEHEAADIINRKGQLESAHIRAGINIATTKGWELLKKDDN